MQRQRRQHSAEFKAKVALEAIRGQPTRNVACARWTGTRRWKRRSRCGSKTWFASRCARQPMGSTSP